MAKLDPLDRSAILAILVRRDEALFAEQKAKKVLEEANAKLKGYADALKGFGLDLANDETFQKIKKDYGGEIHNMLKKRGTLPAQSSQQEDSPLPQQQAPNEMPTVAEVVMGRLRVAGDAGSRAAPIQEYIEGTYDKKIHPKTVGMTLFRLQKNGLVTRKGHVWFIAPEAVNPGAGTPGSKDMFK
jgi:hypothetical protein